MKVLLFISAMFLNGIFTPIHDVPVAIFYITESNGMLEMNITFDLEDFSESLEIKTTEIDRERMQNYLREHTSFQFNSQVANLKISEVKIVRDHVKVKGNFGKTIKNIDRIKIENTCLIDVFRHSNVIQVDLNNKSKDYRMHKKRTVINLEY